MTSTTGKRTTATLAAICAALLCVTVLAADSDGPHDWLDRMSIAVQSVSYEGTVIRISNGTAEALKVVHTVTDGVVRERMVSQDGDGLEIIRNGNEVYCILPDQQRVLVEEWSDQSTLFTTLPTPELRFGSEYDVLILEHDRIASRKTVMLAIRPHDEFRYGHRLWLDLETGFPLQTQMIDSNNDTLQQVKFAEIMLNHDIAANAFESSYSTENFHWFTAPARPDKPELEASWESTDLPPGFELVAVHAADLNGDHDTATHMVFSDGLASVSVFVMSRTSDDLAQRTRVGASHSYSTIIEDHRITAVGAVPTVTVERIAESMQPL